MDNIYEVERDDYVGFVDQLPHSARSIKEETNEGVKWFKTYSKKYGNLLCVREIYDSGEEHYYIIDMPKEDERRPAPTKRKIVLETKEEVQAFADILAKLTKKKEVSEND